MWGLVFLLNPSSWVQGRSSSVVDVTLLMFSSHVLGREHWGGIREDCGAELTCFCCSGDGNGDGVEVGGMRCEV